MKINEKEKNVMFAHLNDGDVFCHKNNYYMKIESTYDNDNGDYDNAVSLADGKLYYCTDSATVQPVNCELVIN